MEPAKIRKVRHKSPPDRAAAGPSHDKGTASHRARKLDFDVKAKKPLTGKKFYLELTGPRRKVLYGKLKADIEELGGAVEQFLSKELACVISDRAEAREGERSKIMPSGTSPAVSTPSPFHQTKDSTPNAADSPSNVTQDTRVVTRGQAIVQKATKSQNYGSTNVLTNAKNFKIPVKHIDVLLNYLSREKEKLKLTSKDKKKGAKDLQVIKGEERQLTKPYLKLEDASRRFRPIHKEFKTWPRILLDTRKGSCPYDPNTRNESNIQGAERTPDRPDQSQKTPDVRHKEPFCSVSRSMSRSQSLSRKAISKAASTKNKALKKGFCEFCGVKYNTLERHLLSEQHKKLIKEKNNYLSLDSMIAQGPNLSRFLEDCAKFRNNNAEVSSLSEPLMCDRSGSEDEVCLISEPNTPSKQRTKARKISTERNRKKSDVDGARRYLDVAHKAQDEQVPEASAGDHQEIEGIPEGRESTAQNQKDAANATNTSESRKEPCQAQGEVFEGNNKMVECRKEHIKSKRRLSKSPRRRSAKGASNVQMGSAVETRTLEHEERIDDVVRSGDVPLTMAIKNSNVLEIGTSKEHAATLDDIPLPSNLESPSTSASKRSPVLGKQTSSTKSSRGTESRRSSFRRKKLENVGSPNSSSNRSPQQVEQNSNTVETTLNNESPREIESKRTTTGMKRQSGGRRSLSLQSRKSQTVSGTSQEIPESRSVESSSQEGRVHEDGVLMGVAGEEQLVHLQESPAPSASNNDPVVIEHNSNSGSPRDSSVGKTRRSGGRRSLSLQRKCKTASGSSSQEGVVNEEGVMQGVAGEEHLSPVQSSVEVTITRVLQDGAVDEGGPLRSQEIIVGGEASQNVDLSRSGAVKSAGAERLANPDPVNINQGDENRTVQESLVDNLQNNGVGSSTKHDSQTTTLGNSSPDTGRRLRTKRGSQAMLSPSSQHSSRKRKKPRLATDEELDDVFESMDSSLTAGTEHSVVTATVPMNQELNQGMTSDKTNRTDRFKRKSRRSHGDAPPRKVRGSTIVGDITESTETSTGSPLIREPLPKHGVVLDNTHSSDEFQTLPTPPSREGKRRRKSKSSNTSNMALKEIPTPARKASLRNKPSTIHNSTSGTSATSELDFQIQKLEQNAMQATEIFANKRKGKKPSDTPDDAIGEVSDSSQNSILNLISNKESENRPMERVQESVDHPNDIADKDNVDRDNVSNPQNDGNQRKEAEQQSLELVFRSDLGQEESSFLGFSQEEINDTISRNESSRQLQKDTGQLVENLEKAALNVYCLPSSSDPPTQNNDNNDDDNSSVGSFGEFTIGLVLQKVDNFPSEGSEWEEQVEGFMEKLDTQLEIKRRRESELSTLPSPNFHKSVFENIEKENRGLPDVVEDMHPEPMSDDDISVFEREEADEKHSRRRRRRSARINNAPRPMTRSTPISNVSYSGMCSPSKKRKLHPSPKKDMSKTEQPENCAPKQALRELSTNQLPPSPQPGTRVVPFSTPKRTRRSLTNLGASPRSPRVMQLVLPPGTPQDIQKAITDNYVHDDEEAEVVFPKFSSPIQRDSIISPVKHRVKQKRIKRRHRSDTCLGHRDVQSSPIRPTYMSDLSFGDVTPARKALFMKGKLKHISFASPRRRSKSVSHTPTKTPSFLTFLNELKAGLSPTFYTFKKPHFSLRILQPSHRHCCRPKLSRSLLALNLSIPSDLDLRIYDFHDDDSIEDDDLVFSPLPTDKQTKELHDQCTQTPPSSRRLRKIHPRRLLAKEKRLAQRGKDMEGKIGLKGADKKFNGQSPEKSSGEDKIECVEESGGLRSVKVQASSDDFSAFLDMPSDYYL